MESGFLLYKSSKIHYKTGGNGNKLLFCLHGYGESSDSFDFLEKRVGDEYTMLTIDLPFHGKTEWQEGLYFSPEDLTTIITQLLLPLSVSPQGWSLLGYSMGGRVALQLFEELPERIERMVLVAPDGLKVNGWYWLATQTWAGNRLFRWTMQRPAWFFLVLRIGNRMGVVNRSVFKFTSYYIGDHAVRDDLYRRWTTMRGFRPDLGNIRQRIMQQAVRVRLLYGRYDRIIRWERASVFLKGLGSYGDLTILDAGHQILQPRYQDKLYELLSA